MRNDDGKRGEFIRREEEFLQRRTADDARWQRGQEIIRQVDNLDVLQEPHFIGNASDLVAG